MAEAMPDSDTRGGGVDAGACSGISVKLAGAMGVAIGDCTSSGDSVTRDGISVQPARITPKTERTDIQSNEINLVFDITIICK